MIMHGKGEEEYCVYIKAQMNIVPMTDYMLKKYKELFQQERDKRSKSKFTYSELLDRQPIYSQDDCEFDDETIMYLEKWNAYKVKLIDEGKKVSTWGTKSVSSNHLNENYTQGPVELSSYLNYIKGFTCYPSIIGDDGKLYKDPNDKSTLL